MNKLLLFLIILSNIVLSANNFIFKHEPKKHALIIGNQQYSNFDSIASVKKDFIEVSKKFKEMGFNVNSFSNVKNIREFNKIISDFRNDFQKGDFVVFYFSGHGFSYGSSNYILPTDMPSLIRESKIPYHAISLESIEDLFVQYEPGIIVFFIDACRSIGQLIIKDKSIKGTIKKSSGQSSPPRRIQSTTNTFITYSSKFGTEAQGYNDSNKMSVFTKYLVQHINKKGISFHSVFDDISLDVANETNDEQIPGLYDWSWTDPYFALTDTVNSQIEESWLSTLNTGKEDLIKKFIRRNSISNYVKAAQKWLDDYQNTKNKISFTHVSPSIVDSSWDLNKESIRIKRLSLDLAYNRTITETQEKRLNKISRIINSNKYKYTIDKRKEIIINYINNTDLVDNPIQTSSLNANSLFNLNDIAQHQNIVAIKNYNIVHTTSKKPMKINYGDKLSIKKIHLLDENKAWITVVPYGKTDTVSINLSLNTVTSPLVLGMSIQETIIKPRKNSIPGLINANALKLLINNIHKKKWKITWISLSTAKTNNLKEKENRIFRLSNTKFILKKLGIMGTRVTSVIGKSDFNEAGVRVRVFGTK